MGLSNHASFVFAVSRCGISFILCHCRFAVSLVVYLVVSHYPIMAKRKINTENRLFQKNWETDFFFIEFNGQPQCLICRKIITVMKKDNVSRHYNTCHAKTYNVFSGQSRIILIESLKQQRSSVIDTEINNSCSDTLQQQSATASYAVALEIARAKRCFSDGEVIKKCAIEMAKAFKNENAVECFKTVALSSNTISKRISEISRHIEDKLQILFAKCRYFSLCIDESTDVTDTSQISIFVRMIDDNFSIDEELVALVPLHLTTKGVDIFNAVREEIEKYGGFSKCSAIVTDGARSMVGKENGFRGLLKKNGINCPTLHCIIHQEALCAKVLMLGSTLKIVSRIINLIRGGNRALLHRKFQTFLRDVNATYGDLCLYNNIRWLSAGETLKRFFNLRNEIFEFLKNEVKTNTEDIQEKMKEIKFLSELAYLTDIISHLNNLNTKLQQQKQTISDLIGHIDGFQNQLILFIDELEASELHHFPSCQEIAQEYSNIPVNFSEFRSSVLEIQEQFQKRFEDFNLLRNDLHIFNNPKGCIIKDQKIEYRMELCTLQADPFLLSHNEYGLDFFKLLSRDKYPKLVELGLKLCSMFGSTYKCESSFSLMKYIKSKYRSNLTNQSLCSLLRIATTQISVDISSLVKEMNHPQIAH